MDEKYIVQYRRKLNIYIDSYDSLTSAISQYNWLKKDPDIEHICLYWWDMLILEYKRP